MVVIKPIKDFVVVYCIGLITLDMDNNFSVIMYTVYITIFKNTNKGF